MHKLSYTLMAILFLFACGKAPETRPTTPLVVTTASNGEIRFNVETAKTPEELQKGLMHRTEMASNNGMIFVFEPVRPVQMWMKNTKLSLDMLFVAANGKIVMIKEKATPMSETRITCKEPVKAVIELNAGQVARHKIQVGDIVKHSVFDQYTTLSDKPIAPKGPKALPKEPKSIGNPDGPVIPKGPKALPKGPKSIGNPDGPVIPKGPKAIGNPDGPVIPKGPKAIKKQADDGPQPIVPVVPPM